LAVESMIVEVKPQLLPKTLAVEIVAAESMTAEV
jgi:hypothetical protein